MLLVCRICTGLMPFLVVLSVLTTATTTDEEVSSEMEDSPQLHHRKRPLRPALSISDRVPSIQLLDSTYGDGQQVRVPKRRQLRVQMLTAVLGQDLDPSWMAVEKPPVLTEGPDYGASAKKLTAELLASNLTREMDGEIGSNRFEEWMLKRAACPVRYVWDDVGPLFWPRWIKRGECVNDPQRSCSWPPGMHCVPAESLIVHLLRWHCRPRSRRSSRMPSLGSKMAAGSARSRVPERADHKQFRCQWLKVPYPVTAECFCSC